MTPQQISDRGNQNRLSEGLTHDAREVYKVSAIENPTRPNQNTRNRHRTSCVTSVMPNGSTRCPSLPVSVRRASRRPGHAAVRWPPASLDSSYAPRSAAVSEKQSKNWPPSWPPDKTATKSADPCIPRLPGYTLRLSCRIPREESHGTATHIDRRS